MKGLDKGGQGPTSGCCAIEEEEEVGETVIITVLNSVTRQRLMKTEDFYVSCGYNDIWSMWFSGSVIVGCVVDP
jgi:hypothetical protein